MKRGIDDAAPLVARGLEHDGARAVAEEDAGAAVGVVGDAGQRFGAEDEDVAVAAGGDEVGGGLECVDEAGAGGGKVEGGGGVQPERGGDEAGGAV